MANAIAEARAKLEATAAAFVKENRLPGAAVGVVHDDRLVWSAGIGFADLARRRKANPKTLYRIASITKTFTATAIMQLRDEGSLSLDDPVLVYLPELKKAKSAFGPAEAITIRRLLSHESGLQSEPPGTDFAAVRYESAAAENLARAKEISATVPPNTQWKYSNLGYQLLGEIVGRVSGRPYHKVVQARLFRPLQLTSTAFDPKGPLAARRATGYDPRFLSDELEPAPVPADAVFEAEGGLWSCVEDLGRWLSFQLGDGKAGGKQLVAKETLAEMHKPRYLVDEKWTRAWAIGWYAVRQDDVIWRMHSGGHYGFITNACFDPTEKVGAIVLLNGFGFATQLAMKIGAIAREAVQAAAPAITAPEKLPDEWRPLVGLYVMKHFGGVIRLEWRDGKLTFVDDTDPTWTPALEATDDPDIFVVEPGFRESGELVRFKRDRKGRVVSVLMAVATMERLEPVSPN
jgi:CubicO group peptidase (beta-lactamase class C family)